jgi:hypothetical protein
MITWKMLLEECPAFAELRDDAVSIAEHEARPWYEHWLPDSSIFLDACWQGYHRFGCTRLDDVRFVAAAGLVDAYRVAKARLQRKGRTPRPWRSPE